MPDVTLVLGADAVRRPRHTGRVLTPHPVPRHVHQTGHPECGAEVDDAADSLDVGAPRFRIGHPEGVRAGDVVDLADLGQCACAQTEAVDRQINKEELKSLHGDTVVFEPGDKALG